MSAKTMVELEQRAREGDPWLRRIIYILMLIVALLSRCLSSVCENAVPGPVSPPSLFRHQTYAHNNFSSSRIHLQTSPRSEDSSRCSSPSYTVSSVACPPCRAHSS